MDVDVRSVGGCPDFYLVDNEMMGFEEILSTYVLDAERPALLDAGTVDGVERILAAMDEIGVAPADVEYVILSHVHLDHAAGTARLLDACGNATVLIHERGRPYLTDPDRLDRLRESVEEAMGFEEPYGDPSLVPDDRCRSLVGDETIDLGDRVLDVYDAPGHAPHHFACLEPDSGTLFAADAVGAYNHVDGVVIPSTPPPNFDLPANLKTVERLRDLAPSRVLYSHYGPGEQRGAVDELASYADVLEEWVETVRETRAAVGDDVDAMLTELTPEWASTTLRRDIVGVCRYLDQVNRS